MPSTTAKYFTFAHLPPKLQAVSKPIGELAEKLETMLPDGAEKSAGMRKLLEAKDCFVRASLDMPEPAANTTPPHQQRVLDEKQDLDLPASPPAAQGDDAIEADPAPRWPQGQAPRVTMEMVNEQIVGETYTVLPSGRVTVCELTLKNGFTVRGESAVVFIENNVPQTGREIARKKAADQIWQLLGYELRTKLANT